MFGYVFPNQDELKVRELREYKAYYCGLCRCLKKEYGIFGQITLNYDMTFLGMLLTALYEPDIICKNSRCIMHPMCRHQNIKSVYMEYAAAMNVVLTYYKCKDDWKDEHKLLKAAYAIILRHKVKSIMEKYPDKIKKIADGLKKLSMAEKDGNYDIDYVSGCFGEICSAIFVYKEDEWHEELHRLGFFFGKFIYLLDAYEDFEKDIKNKCYNPYKNMKRENFDDKIYSILIMMMSEAGRAFERLPIVQNLNIFRNIIYSGVWIRYENIKKRHI